MRIVFRCDASSDIGWGHLSRCLALAQELGAEHQIIFATIEDQTNAIIKEHGFGTFFKYEDETEEAFLDRVKSDLNPNIIVIDKKYPYSADCLKDLKRDVERDGIKIAMIDNLCEGLAASDEIIFPVAHLDKTNLKKYLSKEQIERVKTGFEYVIVRDGVLRFKDQITRRLHPPQTIVVTTGGADPEGILIKLILLLKEMDLDANILVLVGQAFKFRKELEDMRGNLPDNFRMMPYLLQELVKCGIAICTFGVSIYEMIYLQIPTICISHSIENAHGARLLKERYGVIEDMGYINDINPEDLYSTIKKLLTDKAYYRNMAERCGNLIDGKGAKRVGQIIEGGG